MIIKQTFTQKPTQIALVFIWGVSFFVSLLFAWSGRDFQPVLLIAGSVSTGLGLNISPPDSSTNESK